MILVSHINPQFEILKFACLTIRVYESQKTMTKLPEHSKEVTIVVKLLVQ